MFRTRRETPHAWVPANEDPPIPIEDHGALINPILTAGAGFPWCAISEYLIWVTPPLGSRAKVSLRGSDERPRAGLTKVVVGGRNAIRIDPISIRRTMSLWFLGDREGGLVGHWGT